MEAARQVWDENRHVMGLYRRLKELGGHKGEFPVANFEWTVSSYVDSAIGRITVMNRTFEAGTMDVMASLPDGWRDEGKDPQTAELLDAIAADEIHHVRFANHWVHRLCAENKRNLLKVAQAVRFLDVGKRRFRRPPAPPTSSAWRSRTWRCRRPSTSLTGSLPISPTTRSRSCSRSTIWSCWWHRGRAPDMTAPNASQEYPTVPPATPGSRSSTLGGNAQISPTGIPARSWSSCIGR